MTLSQLCTYITTEIKKIILFKPTGAKSRHLAQQILNRAINTINGRHKIFGPRPIIIPLLYFYHSVFYFIFIFNLKPRLGAHTSVEMGFDTNAKVVSLIYLPASFRRHFLRRVTVFRVSDEWIQLLLLSPESEHTITSYVSRRTCTNPH